MLVVFLASIFEPESDLIVESKHVFDLASCLMYILCLQVQHIFSF